MAKYLQAACADIEVVKYDYQWNREVNGTFYHYLVISFKCVDASGNYLVNRVHAADVEIGNDESKIDLTAMNTYMDAAGTRTIINAKITELKLMMADVVWP